MPKKRKGEQTIPPFVAEEFLHGKAKVSSKGWAVIPKAIRDALGIKPGDELSFTTFPPSSGGGSRSIHIMKVPKTRKELLELTRSMFPSGPGEPSLTEQLLRDRRADREREEHDAGPPLKSRRRKTA